MWSPPYGGGGVGRGVCVRFSGVGSVPFPVQLRAAVSRPPSADAPESSGVYLVFTH